MYLETSHEWVQIKQIKCEFIKVLTTLCTSLVIFERCHYKRPHVSLINLNDSSNFLPQNVSKMTNSGVNNFWSSIFLDFLTVIAWNISWNNIYQHIIRLSCPKLRKANKAINVIVFCNLSILHKCMKSLEQKQEQQ